MPDEATWYNGILEIDHKEGTIKFTNDRGVVLRITHLPTPVPHDIMIDIAAIKNVTSYTPIEGASIDMSDIDESGELGI